MNQIIIHITCSDFGKKSTIGYRSYKIYEKLCFNKNSIHVIARTNSSKYKKIISTYPIFLISRIFNFIRVYIKSSFPARKLEISLFNLYIIPYIIYFRIRYRSIKRKVHLWDTSYWFTKFVSKLGFNILLDISMTPSYASLIEASKNYKYYQDKVTTQNQLKEEKAIMKIANKCICPSEYTGDFIKNNYHIDKKKITIIPFGADLINAKSIYKNDDAKIIKLGYVGIINMRKGIRWLIAVLNEIKKDHTNINFELNLYGRIFREEYPFLKDAKFKIINHGFVDKNENIFPNFDILVHPSFLEGSAKSIYEAISYGLPVICTKQSGSVCKHSYNSFIVEAGDSKKLYIYLIKLLSNKSLIKKMGKRSKILSHKFTWENYANNVNKVYIK